MRHAHAGPGGAGRGAAFPAALHRVEALARFATRRVPCPDACDDLATEAVALAWRAYVALLRRGKDPAGFVTTLAQRTAQAALAGRRVCGAEKARDALSPLSRLRGGWGIYCRHRQIHGCRL